jgi:hypothetical protein
VKTEKVDESKKETSDAARGLVVDSGRGPGTAGVVHGIFATPALTFQPRLDIQAA